ncbi:hypothetical protein PRIPAC_72676 [Pristionchus pacificus]|uniref:Uncharacterized protein n=1 Tax=Pristionchus pacificus TaxID=54126 RepID=A0A8R1V489_PRIPA|nr:hypothetical protein PRIPAC_72676 [Pristionchus pacificus]
MSPTVFIDDSLRLHSPGAVKDPLPASGAPGAALQGFTCLACWLLFNLWILRDYFFPSFFEPLYNEKGISKKKLSLKKNEIIMRQKISRAFSISASIPFGGSVSAATQLSTIGREDRSYDQFIV